MAIQDPKLLLAREKHQFVRGLLTDDRTISNKEIFSKLKGAFEGKAATLGASYMVGPDIPANIRRELNIIKPNNAYARERRVVESARSVKAERLGTPSERQAFADYKHDFAIQALREDNTLSGPQLHEKFVAHFNADPVAVNRWRGMTTSITSHLFTAVRSELGLSSSTSPSKTVTQMLNRRKRQDKGVRKQRLRTPREGVTRIAATPSKDIDLPELRKRTHLTATSSGIIARPVLEAALGVSDVMGDFGYSEVVISTALVNGVPKTRVQVKEERVHVVEQ